MLDLYSMTTYHKDALRVNHKRTGLHAAAMIKIV
jgi:hypothetical protein